MESTPVSATPKPRRKKKSAAEKRMLIQLESAAERCRQQKVIYYSTVEQYNMLFKAFVEVFQRHPDIDLFTP